MPWSKLLAKQIRKHLPAELQQHEGIHRLLEAVDQSYKCYERDRDLSAHAFAISEQEYAQLNHRLKEELYLKQLGLQNLKAEIRNLEGPDADDRVDAPEEDNLLYALSHLGKLMERQKQMEQQLKESQGRLSASVNRFSLLIRNLNSGILVEDAGRHIILANQLFCDIFSVPIAPDLLTGIDCAGSAETSKHLFRNPEAFVDRIDQLLREGRLVTGDLLELTDGRVLLRDFIPVHLGSEYLGHMWRYEDVTKEKKSQGELQRLSMVASANENGVIFTDPAGIISWANEGFVQLTGYPMEEILGRTPLEICRGPLSQKESLKGMLEAFYAGRSFSLEVIHYRRDGTWFWGKATGQPVTDEHGKILRYFAMFEDITEKKNLELDLIEAKEQAEQSARSKEAFLANMSHEIRTPMNAILGMARELHKTPLGPQQRLFLDTINAAGENLLVIINDILDISKIEAGKLTLETIGSSPAAVLDRVTRVMQLKADEKGLGLRTSLDPSVPSVLIGDPYRLNQILLNLVSNAIKFTEKGGVDIDCEWTGCCKGLHTIRFVVKDTGIGMEEGFVAQVFEKFQQEDRSVARKYGGTGLGMSISRQLTELMKGRIFIESRKAKGTTVTLSIPFEAGDESRLPQAAPIATDSTVLRGKKVLLAEDNELNRLIATTVLGRYGASVTEAINGAVAIDLLRQFPFDVILMDVQMPVMDGWEATRIIRREMAPDIPIIALTANAIKGEEENCLAAGMNAFVPKPFDEQLLIQTLTQWLTRPEQIVIPCRVSTT
jgi:PAS domain S-box-containing protein